MCAMPSWRDLGEQDISDLREKVLVEIDRRYRGTEESLFRQMEFYREYLADVKELGPMLDIGCGRGLLMKLMRDVGAKAIGIDLSAMQVDYCRTNGFDVRHDSQQVIETQMFNDVQHGDC